MSTKPFSITTHPTQIAQIITSGLAQNPFSIAKLLLCLSSSNALQHTPTTKILYQTNRNDLFLYNTMIRVRSQSDTPEEVVSVYKRMLHKKMAPNSHTFPFLLNAVARFSGITEGKSFHTHIIKFGLGSNLFVANSMISMYARFREIGGLGFARQLFDEMPKRDLVSWNAMIGGYVCRKQFGEAFELFRRMGEENLEGNEVTVVSLLSACAQSGDLEAGKRIHCYIREKDVNFNVIVGNSLIDMYAKCGMIEESRQVFYKMAEKKNVVAWNSMISGYCRCGSVDTAHQLFDQMPERNIVSWTSMITGYVQNNQSLEALLLFRSMESEKLAPDEVLMVSLLSACSDLGALNLGRSIHACLRKNGVSLDSILGSALIDMYAKCGQIDKAMWVFDGIKEKDVNPWTAMITGLALHGQGKACLQVFSSMEQAKVQPNEITFVGVLCGCSHGGLVEEGLHHFRRMSKVYRLLPQIEHYGCMVDLLGRAGLIKEAQDFIMDMPIESNARVWGALLGACRIHGNVEIGEIAAKVLIDLEPWHGGRYVLLSNIYAAANKWDEVTKVRNLMKDRGVEKEPGWSWIEIDGVVNQFFVGDQSHSRIEEISFMLEGISREIKMVGYVSQRSYSLLDTDEEE